MCDIWRQLDTMHTSFCCFFANFTIFRTREVDICTKRFVLLNFILLILFSCLFFNDIFEDSTDIATRLNGNTEVKKKERKKGESISFARFKSFRTFSRLRIEINPRWWYNRRLPLTTKTCSHFFYTILYLRQIIAPFSNRVNSCYRDWNAQIIIEHGCES